MASENDTPQKSQTAQRAEPSSTAAREEEILTFWKENDIFKKTTEKKAPKGEYIFYEGPPTANNHPAIHHLEARAFKDLVPRYKTMRGYHVRRKAGWDTHGLPVELEVEKELGLKNKKDIEAYGIEPFNKKCRESVQRYIDEWKEFTDRIGFWVDHSETYFTFANDYIESVWHVLKQIHERGLVYKDYRVVPWCARCGTPLSSHEVADGYKDVTDMSVYVLFKLTEKNEYIAAWTTTPWTLPGNVALAVGEEITYAKVAVNGKQVWVAKDLASTLFPEGDIQEEIAGAELVGLEYEPLFPYLKNALEKKNEEKLENAFKIYAADFVSTEDGTGVVHTAVMYGQDDFELGTEIGLPKHHLVNEEGKFTEEVADFAGQFVKDADADVIAALEKNDRLLKKEEYEHTYPHCWRCKQPLIYYARDSWYIKMSGLRDELVKENSEINWEPSHIRDGRFGEWLREVKDWAISRNRYWGTPLPIWVHPKTGEFLVIGSIEELRKRATEPLPENLDLHRPYIDDVKVKGDDGEIYERVPEVVDVWFDSGSMPYAQDHYPFENKEWVDGPGYPADFISEAIDQTRGWFYTLHAIGVLLGRGKAYKNVICLGHLLDKKGKKMSKSVGNVIDPWEMLPKHGADALRFWMYTVNEPGASKNFDERTVDEIVKKNITRLLNVLSFYELYKDEAAHTPTPDSAHVLDRWIVARLQALNAVVTENMDAYRVDRAARPLADFIDDLSTWYLRRSRDRFKGEDAQDKAAALATLQFVLEEFAKMTAPFMPFVSEHVYREVGGEEESVHLASWPEYGEADEELLRDMLRARDIVSVALEQRAQNGIKVRQPLSKLSIQTELSEELRQITADEVNVKEVVVDVSIDAVALNTEITPELAREGQVRDLLRAVQEMRKKKGLKPGEEAKLVVETADQDTRALIENAREELQRAAALSAISFAGAEGGTELTLGEQVVQIALQ